MHINGPTQIVVTICPHKSINQTKPTDEGLASPSFICYSNDHHIFGQFCTTKLNYFKSWYYNFLTLAFS
jgi:hypothetical protein